MIKEEYWLIKAPIYRIKEYFDTCYKTVENDLNQIEEQNENGYYKELGDYERACDNPLSRSDIIYYSTLNELNILCENIIRKIYSDINSFSKTKEKKHQDSNLEVVFQQYHENAKIILLSYKENMNKCIDQIENFHCIRFENLNNYEIFLEIRKRINSYKHRDNIKHKYKKNVKSNYSPIFDKYSTFELDIDNTLNSIESFLLELYKLTRSKNI